MNCMLMNAPMALATQQEIKTQTRRPLKNVKQLKKEANNTISIWFDNGKFDNYTWGRFLKECSRYSVGQKLWIREPAKVVAHCGNNDIDMEPFTYLEYISDGYIETSLNLSEKFGDKKWFYSCKGIPNGCTKEMARTFVIITDIRVERLNDIEYEDILAEGFPMDYEPKSLGTKTYFADTHGEIDYEEDRANEWFANLIESISGKGSFDDKWVLTYKYKTITKEEAEL